MEHDINTEQPLSLKTPKAFVTHDSRVSETPYKPNRKNQDRNKHIFSISLQAAKFRDPYYKNDSFEQSKGAIKTEKQNKITVFSSEALHFSKQRSICIKTFKVQKGPPCTAKKLLPSGILRGPFE